MRHTPVRKVWEIPAPIEWERVFERELNPHREVEEEVERELEPEKV